MGGILQQADNYQRNRHAAAERVMTAQRKKRGRPPSLWHGPRGKEFVTAVCLSCLDWGQRQKSIAHTIDVVVKRGFPDLRGYKRRYLQKRFCDALVFWSPYRELYEASKAFSTISTARLTWDTVELGEQKIAPQPSS